MKKITDLQKVKMAMVLASARFWVIVIVLYLSTKNLTTEQIFQTINVYYLMSMLLEYPTGVIGDYFSHKLSVLLGYILLAIALVFVTVANSYLSVIFFYFIYAVGGTLISGSDSALLYSLSKDFKKEVSQIKIWGTLVSAGALTVGGWLGSIDLRYPFYATALFFAFSFLLLFSVKEKVSREKRRKKFGNIFSLAKEGLREVKANKELLYLLVVASVGGSLYYNLKWMYNPLFMELGIDVKYWGFIGGSALFCIVLGAFLYKKTKERKIVWPFLFLLLAVILTGFTFSPLISLFGLLLVHLVRGYFGTKMSVEISRTVSDKVRASVLSFKSLLIRLGTMGMVTIIGFVLGHGSFMILMPVLAGIIVLIAGYPVLKLSSKSFAK